MEQVLFERGASHPFVLLALQLARALCDRRRSERPPSKSVSVVLISRIVCAFDFTPFFLLGPCCFPSFGHCNQQASFIAILQIEGSLLAQNQQLVLTVVDNLQRQETLNISYHFHLHDGGLIYGHTVRIQKTFTYSVNLSTSQIGAHVLEIHFGPAQVQKTWFRLPRMGL